jgi:hypothetical protein
MSGRVIEKKYPGRPADDRQGAGVGVAGAVEAAAAQGLEAGPVQAGDR